jgi:hypothetical protein
MSRLAASIYEEQAPEVLDQSELRGGAIRKFNVSKNSFEFAWIDAIVAKDGWQPDMSTAARRYVGDGEGYLARHRGTPGGARRVQGAASTRAVRLRCAAISRSKATSKPARSPTTRRIRKMTRRSTLRSISSAASRRTRPAWIFRRYLVLNAGN